MLDIFGNPYGTPFSDRVLGLTCSPDIHLYGFSGGLKKASSIGLCLGLLFLKGTSAKISVKRSIASP